MKVKIVDLGDVLNESELEAFNRVWWNIDAGTDESQNYQVPGHNEILALGSNIPARCDVVFRGKLVDSYCTESDVVAVIRSKDGIDVGSIGEIKMDSNTNGFCKVVVKGSKGTLESEYEDGIPEGC